MSSQPPLTLTPSGRGLPDGWTPERFHDELAQAAASFNQAAVTCDSPHLTVVPPEARRIAVEDGTSLIAFRSDQWCHNSRCGHLDTFPFRAMAMTETFPAGASRADIREADIELNAVHFRFTGRATEVSPEERVVPLRAVLLHELGHALGLEDRCVPEGRHGVHAGVPELDLCRTHEAESVMFAPALNLELSPLDVAALCAVHLGSGALAPASRDPSGSSSMNWSSIGGAFVPIALLLVLAVVLVRVFRRSVPAR